MSEFREMSVTVQRGDEFRTVILDETHDVSVVERMGERALRIGYEIVSVVVSTHMFDLEMLEHVGGDDMEGICTLLETLSDDAREADVILAYTTVADIADVPSWQDKIIFSGDAESICQEWAEAFERRYQETSGDSPFVSQFVAAPSWPEWLEIDWESSLDSLARREGADVVELEGMFYYFG